MFVLLNLPVVSLTSKNLLIPLAALLTAFDLIILVNCVNGKML